MVSLSPMHLLLPVYQVYLPQLLYPGQVDSTLLHSKYRYSTQYTYRYSTHYTSTVHTVHSTHLNSQVQVWYTVHSYIPSTGTVHSTQYIFISFKINLFSGSTTLPAFSIYIPTNIIATANY